MELNRTFNQEECTNIIINHIVNKKEKQALLIDGDWGSGKTFFINKFINDIGAKCEDRATYLLNNQKKITLTNEEEDSFKNKNILPIISLYGLNSIDEIRFKIFKTHIPLLSKDSKKTDLCIDFFASNFVNIVKLIKPEAKETLDSLKFENINKVIETLNLTKDKVIIFDDLERCNIELNTLFGYINELMEEDNTKVILISNEKEIINSILYKKIEQKYLAIGYLMKNNTETNGAKDGVFNLLELKTDTSRNEQVNFPWKENDSNKINLFNSAKLEELNKLIFAESKTYNKIKEKIIGTTINFSADIYKDFENIIKQYIDDDDIIRTINLLKSNIINILTINKFFNYRCLIFWLIKINKIFISLKQLNTYNTYTDYIKQLESNIVKSTLFYAIQIKKNNRINPDALSKFVQNNREIGKDRVELIALAEENNPYLDYSYSFLTLRNFMLYGYFNTNIFKEEIDIFVKIQEDQNDLRVIVYKINGGLLAFSKEELMEQLNRILNRLEKAYESDIKSYNILFELVFNDLSDNELIEYALDKSKDEYVDDIVQLMIKTLMQSKITIRHINVNTNITDDTYKEKIKLLNDVIDKTNLRINKLENNKKISNYLKKENMEALNSLLYDKKINYLTSFNIDDIQQFIENNLNIEGNNKNFGLFIYIIGRLNTDLDTMDKENINKYYTYLTILSNKLNELIKTPIKDKIKKQGIITLIKNLEERKNTLDSYNSKGIK